MPKIISPDQVIALAPDAGSAKSGRELANPQKWVVFAANDQALWGECQGSGSKPYRTCVDLGEELAFKCSCPSRKFPCKHGLGLLLMLANTACQLSCLEMPDWVSSWIEGRNARAEMKLKKTDSEKVPADPERKAKTQAKRLEKVESGMEEFRLWLKDKIRQGIAGFEWQTYDFFDAPAARLVDAQAAGLARMLRRCSSISKRDDDWQIKLMERLALIHLASEGFSRIGRLPDTNLDEELYSLVGFNKSQEEILANEPALPDSWKVLGQRVNEEERLKVQRTWLYGTASRRAALVLQFAHGTQALDSSLVPGTVFDGELVFFSSSYPLRALVKSRHVPDGGLLDRFSTTDSISSLYSEFADAIAFNPFLDSLPAGLDELFVTCREGNDYKNLVAVDSENSMINLNMGESAALHLLAISGGDKVSLFGEWNGQALLPLSLLCQGKFHGLARRN